MAPDSDSRFRTVAEASPTWMSVSDASIRRGKERADAYGVRLSRDAANGKLDPATAALMREVALVTMARHGVPGEGPLNIGVSPTKPTGPESRAQGWYDPRDKSVNVAFDQVLNCAKQFGERQAVNNLTDTVSHEVRHAVDLSTDAQTQSYYNPDGTLNDQLYAENPFERKARLTGEDMARSFEPDARLGFGADAPFAWQTTTPQEVPRFAAFLEPRHYALYEESVKQIAATVAHDVQSCDLDIRYRASQRLPFREMLAAQEEIRDARAALVSARNHRYAESQRVVDSLFPSPALGVVARAVPLPSRTTAATAPFLPAATAVEPHSDAIEVSEVSPESPSISAGLLDALDMATEVITADRPPAIVPTTVAPRRAGRGMAI